jgi:hypothetical protein
VADLSRYLAPHQVFALILKPIAFDPKVPAGDRNSIYHG